LFALTGRAIVTDENFAFRDAAHYYYPQFAWEDRHWRAGTLPLWNPQDNLGASVAADPTASVFYPGKLLFRAPLPYPTRFKLYTLAHLFGAALGAFVLVRTWHCSRSAAVLAAISYACGGNVLFLYSNVVYLVGAAWLPWAVAMLERLAREASVLAVLGLSATLALMILGGDPQTAAHVLLIGMLRVVLDCPSPVPSPAPVSAPLSATLARAIPSRRWRAWLVIVSGAAAFGLSAAQSVPTWLASRHSGRAAFDEPRTVWEIVPWLRTRHAESTVPDPRSVELWKLSELDEPDSSEFLPSERSTTVVAGITRGLIGPPRAGTHHQQLYDFSVGPWRLVELLAPNALGTMFPRYARWGFAIPAEGRIWTPSLYQGLLPVLLAIVGLLVRTTRPPDTTVRWLAWSAALSILGSFGSYGLGWLVREICGDLSLRSPDWLGDATGGVYWLLVTCVPSFVQFRYPAKLWTVAALAIAGLAAKAFDRMTTQSAGAADEVETSNENDPVRMRKWLRRIAGSLAIVAAMVLVALAVVNLSRRWAEWLQGVADDPWLGPLDVSRAFSDTVWGLASCLVIATLGWYLATRSGRAGATSPTNSLRWVWILVTMIDLVIANRWLIATAPPDAWETGTEPLAAVARNRYARAGGAGELPEQWQQAGSADRLADTVSWDAATLFSKMHLLGEAGSIEAPVAAESHDYLALLQVARTEGTSVGETGLELPRTLREMLGVGAIITPTRLRPTDQSSTPGEPPVAPPRVELTPETARRTWVVRDVERLAELSTHSPEAERRRAREILFPPGRERDWAREAVVETDIEFTGLDRSGNGGSLPTSRRAASDERGADHVQMIDDELHRVRVEVMLPSPALLVLADRFDPDWQVDVRDERQQPLAKVSIIRTNRVCRGVWLPAGHWTVDFRYRPTPVYCGIVVSVLSWIAWIALVFTRGRRSGGVRTTATCAIHTSVQRDDDSRPMPSTG